MILRTVYISIIDYREKKYGCYDGYHSHSRRSTSNVAVAARDEHITCLDGSGKCPAFLLVACRSPHPTIDKTVHEL
jgi:hypothetical protein